MMTPKNVLPRKRIAEFIDHLYEGDLHAKRVLSLSNATLGVLVSASLAVHTIGQGMAQALGKLSKHGVKQVDRLLSNQGIDVWAFFGYWVPYLVGAPLGSRGGDGLDELREGRTRHGGVVDVDGSWTGDAADVEDGGVVVSEGADEAPRDSVAGAVCERWCRRG